MEREYNFLNLDLSISNDGPYNRHVVPIGVLPHPGEVYLDTGQRMGRYSYNTYCRIILSMLFCKKIDSKLVITLPIVPIMEVVLKVLLQWWHLKMVVYLSLHNSSVLRS